VERQFNTTVLTLVTDNRGEYVEADKFIRTKGIKHIYTPPYSHQSNGVPERYNRTIQTMARSMILDLVNPSNPDPKPDLKLWGEACNQPYIPEIAYPIHSYLKAKRPFEMLYNKQSSIAHLKPFGSPFFVHTIAERRIPGRKITQPRADSAILVGFTDSPSIYKVQLATNKQMVTVRASLCTFIQPEAEHIPALIFGNGQDCGEDNGESYVRDNTGRFGTTNQKLLSSVWVGVFA